jgi:hypothetical protein
MDGKALVPVRRPARYSCRVQHAGPEADAPKEYHAPRSCLPHPFPELDAQGLRVVVRLADQECPAIRLMLSAHGTDKVRAHQLPPIIRMDRQPAGH